MAFFEINGRSVAYRLLGAKANPLVVLAHPLGMSQAVWDDILPVLLPRYRMLSWDLPGHGASQAWPLEPGEITPADLASEALVLAEQAGASRFHFVGTSIGGVVGQQLLAEHAEQLLSATLTNTGAVIGNAELWTTRARRVREEGLAALSGEIVPRWFAPSCFKAQPGLEAGWRTQMARTDGESYARLCEMLARCDYRHRLADNRVSVRLFGGTDDMATPPACLNELADALGGAPVTVFSGIGHVPSVECPERFAQALVGCLTNST